MLMVGILGESKAPDSDVRESKKKEWASRLAIVERLLRHVSCLPYVSQFWSGSLEIIVGILKAVLEDKLKATQDDESKSAESMYMSLVFIFCCREMLEN